MIIQEISTLILETERKAKEGSSAPSMALGALAGTGLGYGASKLDNSALPIIGAGLGTLGGLALYHKYKNSPKQPRVKTPPQYCFPQYYQSLPPQ